MQNTEKSQFVGTGQTKNWTIEKENIRTLCEPSAAVAKTAKNAQRNLKRKIFP